MKKFQLLCVLLALSTTFSCSKVEPEIVEPEPSFFPIEMFVGGWSYTSVEIEGQSIPYPHREDCNRDFFVFRHNEGQWNQYEEILHSYEECGIEATILDWRISAKTLKLYFGESLVMTYEIISVDEEELLLSLTGDFDDNGSEEEAVLTAVRYDPYGEFGAAE